MRRIPKGRAQRSLKTLKRSRPGNFSKNFPLRKIGRQSASDAKDAVISFDLFAANIATAGATFGTVTPGPNALIVTVLVVAGHAASPVKTAWHGQQHWKIRKHS